MRVNFTKVNECIVFIAGDHGKIVGISWYSHKIIDKWNVGDSVTTKDCINKQDGGIIFAIWTSKGCIFLRYDWQEYRKSFFCGE